MDSKSPRAFGLRKLHQSPVKEHEMTNPITAALGKAGIMYLNFKGRDPALLNSFQENSTGYNRYGSTFVMGERVVFVFGKPNKVVKWATEPARILSVHRQRLRHWDCGRHFHPVALVRNHNEDGDSLETVLLVKSDLLGMDFKTYMRLNVDTHCTHEYDCCGNWYHTARTHKTVHLGRGYYLVHIDSYRNV